MLRAEGGVALYAPRRDDTPDLALLRMLRQPDAVLQRYISSPLLVNRQACNLASAYVVSTYINQYISSPLLVDKQVNNSSYHCSNQ